MSCCCIIKRVLSCLWKISACLDETRCQTSKNSTLCRIKAQTWSCAGNPLQLAFCKLMNCWCQSFGVTTNVSSSSTTLTLAFRASLLSRQKVQMFVKLKGLNQSLLVWNDLCAYFQICHLSFETTRDSNTMPSECTDVSIQRLFSDGMSAPEYAKITRLYREFTFSLFSKPESHSSEIRDVMLEPEIFVNEKISPLGSQSDGGHRN